MAQSKQDDDWHHTAAIICIINNVNAVKKKDQREPGYFHPFTRKKPKRKLTRQESRDRLNQFVESYGAKRRNTKGRSRGHRTGPGQPESGVPVADSGAEAS